MELIKKLDRRYDRNNRYKIRYGLFLCPYCKNKVEKMYNHGLRDKSCGCMTNQLKIKSKIIHGDSLLGKRTRLYNIWMHIKQRCNNIKNERYNRYGGRGITICNKWINSYVNFKNWALSNGYNDNLTIDRIDNDGNYEPNNCQWVTISENNRNTSKTKLNWLTVRLIRALRDAGYTRKELYNIFDINLSTLGSIIYNFSWIK